MSEQRPILICFDGSEDAAQALVRAAALFPERDAIVVHVWEPLKEVASVPPVPGLQGALAAGLEEMDRIGEEASERIAAEGAERATVAGLRAEPLSVKAPGRAWRNILAAADERDVDAIVLGQRGLGGAGRALLGSVSTAVVHHAKRPVVIVPTDRADQDV